MFSGSVQCGHFPFLTFSLFDAGRSSVDILYARLYMTAALEKERKKSELISDSVLVLFLLKEGVEGCQYLLQSDGMLEKWTECRYMYTGR